MLLVAGRRLKLEAGRLLRGRRLRLEAGRLGFRLRLLLGRRLVPEAGRLACLKIRKCQVSEEQYEVCIQ